MFCDNYRDFACPRFSVIRSVIPDVVCPLAHRRGLRERNQCRLAEELRTRFVCSPFQWCCATCGTRDFRARQLAKKRSEQQTSGSTCCHSMDACSLTGEHELSSSPGRRWVGLKAATASSRAKTVPTFVRSRPSRTRWTISLSWARSDSTTKST